MFLSPSEAANVRERFGTLCYLYDRRILEQAARTALAFPAPFGFTLRYAMKANPSAAILRIFRGFGLHIDASSDHEVERALRIGLPADTIQLTSQMPSCSLEDFVARGVRYNACSLHQLERFGGRRDLQRLSLDRKRGRGRHSVQDGPDQYYLHRHGIDERDDVLLSGHGRQLWW